MNKRQLKKLKNKQFLKIISVVEQDDIVIFEFDKSKQSPEQLQHFVDRVQKVISNKMIFVPKNDMKALWITKDNDFIISQLEDKIKELRDDKTIIGIDLARD